MKNVCHIHNEEAGERRPAVAKDDEFGPVCAECACELGVTRAAERRYAAQYAYACGYRD